MTLDDLGRPSFDLAARRARPSRSSLQLLGEHQATNAAATAATALAAGLGLAEVAESLRGIDHLSKWRMELHERADGLVVVNDAYNANPDSMRAALETLARMGQRSGRRTVAVLGEMRELGPSSEEEHRAVGALAARARRSTQVVVVGCRRPTAIHEALRRRAWRGRHDAPGRHRRTRPAEWLRENVPGPDVVLVKASAGAGGSNASPTCSCGRRGRHDS